MKRFVYILFFLAMATYAEAATSPSMQRVLATSPKVTVNPADTSTKARIFVSYSSAEGKVYRLADLDSIFQMGGIETTAPEGQRYIYPYNGTTGFTGTPARGMLATTSTGPKWYDGEAWLPIGVAYDDTSLWAAFANYMLKADHDAYAAAVQVKFDNLSTQVAQLKTAVVNGGGTLPGAAPASLDTLDFGSINVSTTKTLTAQIDNTGLGNLTMGTASKSGTGAAKYTLNGGCSGQTVAPGASCIESITFAPGTVAGTYTAQISFPHNAQGSPTVLNVTGTGVAIQTCSTTPYADIQTNGTTSDSTVGSTTYNVYSGIRIAAGQATHTICKVGFYVRSVVVGGVTNGGTLPAGVNYRVEVWGLDANNKLDTVQGVKGVSAPIAGSTLSAGSNPVLAFAQPVTLSAGDVVVVTRDDHASDSANFLNLQASGTTSESYSYAIRFQGSGALGQETTGTEKKFQLYEVQ